MYSLDYFWSETMSLWYEGGKKLTFEIEKKTNGLRNSESEQLHWAINKHDNS